MYVFYVEFLAPAGVSLFFFVHFPTAEYHELLANRAIKQLIRYSTASQAYGWKNKTFIIPCQLSIFWTTVPVKCRKLDIFKCAQTRTFPKLHSQNNILRLTFLERTKNCYSKKNWMSLYENFRLLGIYCSLVKTIPPAAEYHPGSRDSFISFIAFF